MAPGGGGGGGGAGAHTGTIPKNKMRNCVVPQEAVTPTRRDQHQPQHAHNLASTSLDWVPVSEYNTTRANYGQSSRSATYNNTGHHHYSDLDNSISLESGAGRFVPVRPQPRAHRGGMPEHGEDGAGNGMQSSYNHNQYQQPTANGVSPHGNHTAAAVMIVNPTTPNTVTGNTTQQSNAPANTNRNNLTRALQSGMGRSSVEGASNNGTLQVNNNSAPVVTNGRSATKTNNLINNVYDQGQNDNTQSRGLSVRAMGEEMVSVCPDAASVERRLGQIREYIRVTSSLVDTMRNSEDEAYIEHTKEEYDELVEMVMKLKESETKLVNLLDGTPENSEILTEEASSTLLEQKRPSSTNPFVEDAETEGLSGENTFETVTTVCDHILEVPKAAALIEELVKTDLAQEDTSVTKPSNIETMLINNNLAKKIINIENEQHIKSNDKLNIDDAMIDAKNTTTVVHSEVKNNELEQVSAEKLYNITENNIENLEIALSRLNQDSVKSEEDLNELLKKNIEECNEKLALIEELKKAKRNATKQQNQKEGGDRSGDRAMKFCKLLDRLALSGALEASNLTNNLPHVPTNYQEMTVRPMSVQSNGSAYSDNELWQSELKAKMEVSQQRLATLQEQQTRLLKYKADAKQQLAEIQNMNRNRQFQENLQHQPPGQENQHQPVAVQNMFAPNQHHTSRTYNSNQIGVATTLLHTGDTAYHLNTSELNMLNGGLSEVMDHSEPSHSGHHYSHSSSRNTNMPPEQEEAGRGRSGDRETGEEGEGSEEEEMLLNEHGRALQHKLRDLHLKKRHMEQLVADFQKLQAAERGRECGGEVARNTYCSSPDDSGPEEDNTHHDKCNKAGSNMKNDDPFKLMEISAIKAALQKTKDLMRRVERYEPQESAAPQDDFMASAPSHSNINDNKSEGGHSAGGWSNDSSLCRVHNSIQQHKLTNHTPQPHAASGPQDHEASISSLQMLAQQLRQEAESIAEERKRLKHSLLNKKDGGGGSVLCQKRVNAEVACSSSEGGRCGRGEGRLSPGPLERKQMALRAELAEKQRQLQMILNKEKEMCGNSPVQKAKADSCSYPAMNQSYNSEQEEGDSREEEMWRTHSQNHPHQQHYRSTEDSAYGADALPSAPPPHPAGTYCSDSDSVRRGNTGRRNRRSRPPPQQRLTEDNINVPASSPSGSAAGSTRAEPRADPPAVPVLPQHVIQHPGESANTAYTPHTAWTNNKSNQDVRSNQFTQNSHSQTMDRLLGSGVPFPPSMPHMMLGYGWGSVGGGACACSWWGPWCWQQLSAQQREIQQLRDQLNNMEERVCAAEAAPHALNNQVAPGNRANNYWDNFRSYSRQNLLSANSKTNADGHLGSVQPHNPHPLVERSHNTLHPSTMSTAAPTPTPPSNTPKRNTNSTLVHNANHQQTLTNEEPPARHPRRNYDTLHTHPTAPDVLNVNQNIEMDVNSASSRIVEHIGPMHCVSNVNINPLMDRNLNITNPVPEIIQSHSNNLNATNSFIKKKSSSKLPAKNSSNRRNYSLDFVQNSNIDIASTSELPNPNLASSSQDSQDKATSKLFDVLRENVYSEVTALISANEAHPDFLIQLFRDLQQVSSDPLRQHALQSIRDVLSQYSSIADGQSILTESHSSEITATNNEQNAAGEVTSNNAQNNSNVSFVDRDIINFMLAKSEEICTPELLDTLKSLIIGAVLDAGHSMLYSQKKLKEFLSKYEGSRLRDVSGDIIDNLVDLATGTSEEENLAQQQPSVSDSSASTCVMQDVAGALNLFSSIDSNEIPQLYDPWVHHETIDPGESSSHPQEGRFGHEAKVDLIDCVEIYDGDLAEADQTGHSDGGGDLGNHAGEENISDMLPDVVETEETTPTEAEAEWLGLDRVPTRLHTDHTPANQKD